MSITLWIASKILTYKTLLVFKIIIFIDKIQPLINQTTINLIIAYKTKIIDLFNKSYCRRNNVSKL